jgi:hypothetical protein
MGGKRCSRGVRFEVTLVCREDFTIAGLRGGATNERRNRLGIGVVMRGKGDEAGCVISADSSGNRSLIQIAGR